MYVDRGSESAASSALVHEDMQVHKLYAIVDSKVVIVNGLMSPTCSWALSFKHGVGKQ